MNKRILVLEDDPDFLNCVTLILEAEGFNVNSIREMSVPEDLLAEEPDCILLDEVLPGISGHPICTILKKLQRTAKQIPIVLMSGRKDIKERAGLCGADGFMHKPFHDRELIKMIEKTIN